jgi:hypothetical protein
MRASFNLVAELTKWQDAHDEQYNAGALIGWEVCPKINSVTLLYRDRPPRGVGSSQPEPLCPRCIGSLLGIRAVTVGIDLREYSQRKSEDQLCLSVRLEASVRKAVKILESGGILPPSEPRIYDFAGDGALVVFTSIDHYIKEDMAKLLRCPTCCNRAETGTDPANQKINRNRCPNCPNFTTERQAECEQAIQSKHETERAHFTEVVDRACSFVFALNAILGGDNIRNAGWDDYPRDQGQIPPYPVECRFALSYGDIFLRKHQIQPNNPNDISPNIQLRCSGAGLVTCSRILSVDKGNHFLLHEDLVHRLAGNGGLSSICQGQWGQKFHAALLPKSMIKSDHYRFFDVFGSHHDGPLIRALGRPYQEPHEYPIGSHHVGSIDFGPKPAGG